MWTMLAAAAAQVTLGAADRRYTIDEPLAVPRRRPDWRDEFDGTALDMRKWTADTSRNKAGWSNEERQYYSAANARVANGVLTIEAQADPAIRAAPDWGGQRYSSARLTTAGKAHWTYGTVEVRAKLACGGGLWPAIWMMPERDQPWPDGGEIDIMEHIGRRPGVIHATLHTARFVHSKGTQRGAETQVADACTAFHRYQMRWTPRAITIGVDGRAFFRVANDGSGDRGAWPFDAPFHLILNLAVGGNWPGPVDDAALPARMTVDYVRVWRG